MTERVRHRALTRRALIGAIPAALAATSSANLFAATLRRPHVPRVASLDWALAETMIALGLAPAAVVAASDWPRFVVEPALPPSTVDLGLQQEVNFELLARLDPDLILYSPFLENLAPQLRRIADCVELSIYEDNGAPLALRERVTRELGRRLDVGSRADRYLAAADTELDRLRVRASRLPRRPLLLATFIDARHVRVYAGGSLFQNVLARLGLENAWGEPVGFFGYTLVGIERLATARDVRLVVFDPVPPDLRPKLAVSPLWTQLPFVRAGRVSVLPPVLMFGAMPAALRFARLLVAGIERAGG